MVEAILFSASAKRGVYPEDARNHLKHNISIYWTVDFPIKVDKNWKFPIYGFIHICGKKKVEYVAKIEEIIPFSPHHYEDSSLKPERWRQHWSSLPLDRRPGKVSLVMTEILPFSCPTTSFQMISGNQITRPPQAYARVHRLDAQSTT